MWKRDAGKLSSILSYSNSSVTCSSLKCVVGGVGGRKRERQNERNKMKLNQHIYLHTCLYKVIACMYINMMFMKEFPTEVHCR